MKNYVKFALVAIISLTMIAFLFLLLIKQDNSYITYIKIQVNSSFIIGINNDKNVVFYNALNDDANIYNLSMFQGKNLSAATKIFVEKLGNSEENKNRIFLSIMTKNHSLENEILNIIKQEILDYDNNYQIILNEPTNEELEKYSSEVVYNLKRSFSNENIKEIGREINSQVNNYIDNKINLLKIAKLSNERKRQIIEEKLNNGYFNDYIISNSHINGYNVNILKRSGYEIKFTFDNENNYHYSIILNLEMDYEKKEDKTIIETYKFNYEQGEDFEYIRNLKVYYYTF